MYSFGEQHFPTKEAARKFFQAMLYAYLPGQTITPRDEVALLDLLRKHPRAGDKIGMGLSHFTVEAHPVFHHAPGFWIHRLDGTATDFSYRVCVRPLTPWEQFTRACRLAVAEDIVSFKLQSFAGQASLRCPVLEMPYAFEDMHVDHKPPYTFQRIVKDYVFRDGIDIQAAVAPSADGQYGRCFADPTLAHDFQLYHHVFADLWVISKEAHVLLTRQRLHEKEDA